ncbi:MAG: STAS domain-containing protein [Planctomycetes bacterium]|nr:STAS domain-containing protein [Planctomycetota bacterium]
MTVTSSKTGDRVEIRVSGRFDYNIQQEFRAAYEPHDPRAEFIVDLSGVDYMDSAALGMLLVLREYAGGAQGRVALTHCAPQVVELLEMANYQMLFPINSVRA